MKGKYENMSLRNKTVVCGLDLAVRVTGSWLTLVNTRMNIWIQYNAQLFCSLWGSWSLSRRILLHGSR